MDDGIIPIGMEEMNRIFDVVDGLEISREEIQVDLLPAGDGAVERMPGGKIRIVLPATGDLATWFESLGGAILAVRPGTEGGAS